MKDRYLVIKGCAGLGNRLFTLCSAIEYAKVSDRILVVDWSDSLLSKYGKDIFDSYFELVDVKYEKNGLSLIEANSSYSYYPPVWKGNIRKELYTFYSPVRELKLFSRINRKYLPRGIPRMVKGFWGYIRNKVPRKPGVFNLMRSVFNPNDFPLGGDLAFGIKEDVLIFADYVPLFSEDTFLRHIVLNQGTRNKIDKFASLNFKQGRTIGVHVRNTDLKPRKGISELFKMIDKLDVKDPIIFLATDNAEVEQAFLERYKQLVFTKKMLPAGNTGLHQIAASSNSIEVSNQLEESIIDMWLLADCDYLFYQGNSSFSGVSRILHKDKSRCFDWNK